MGRLPSNNNDQKNPTIAFEKKYDVIYGNYAAAYLERTGLMKTEHWFLNPKTTLAFDKCLCYQGTSKNWKELVESVLCCVLCCIYFCFLHGDALQPEGKNTTCLPSSLFFHLSICISYLEGEKKKPSQMLGFLSFWVMNLRLLRKYWLASSLWEFSPAAPTPPVGTGGTSGLLVDLAPLRRASEDPGQVPSTGWFPKAFLMFRPSPWL